MQRSSGRPGARPQIARATTARSGVGPCSTSCYDSWSTTIANFAQAAGAVRHVDRERVRLRLVRSHRTALHRRLRHDDVHRQTDGGLGQGGGTEDQGQPTGQGHRARSIGMDPRLEQHIGHGLARCQPSAELGSAELWMLRERDWQRRPLALKHAATGMATTTATGSGTIRTAWNAFDILGVHEYDSQIAFAWPADVNGGRTNKEVWQTEMSGVRHWPEEGPSTTSRTVSRSPGGFTRRSRSARLRPGSAGGTRPTTRTTTKAWP